MERNERLRITTKVNSLEIINSKTSELIGHFSFQEDERSIKAQNLLKEYPYISVVTDYVGSEAYSNLQGEYRTNQEAIRSHQILISRGVNEPEKISPSVFFKEIKKLFVEAVEGGRIK
jgi:hypothetical protein